MKVCRDALVEPAESTCVSAACRTTAVDAELGPRDLRHDRREPLPALDAGGVHLGHGPLGAARERDSGLVEIVEALAVGDVLVADREPDAAPQALAVADVAGAAGERHRVAQRGAARAPGGIGIARHRSITSRDRRASR